MRSWIAVVVIAGLTYYGRTQITASAVSTGTQSLPQVQEGVDGRETSLKFLSKGIWQDQQKLSGSQFYLQEWRHDSGVLKTDMSNEYLAGGGNLVRFERHDNFLSHSVLGHDVDSEDGQSQSTNANPVLRQLGELEREEKRAESPGTGYKASTYVPVDSWIYIVFDRPGGDGLHANEHHNGASVDENGVRADAG